MKKLYLNPIAPNPRKIILLMQAKGLDIYSIPDIQVVDVNLATGEHLTKKFSQLNPLHLLPVLELTDGSVINDSQAICEYLDRVYGEFSVMGDSVVNKAQICAMRRIAELEVLYHFMLAFQHTHPSKSSQIDQVPELGPKSIKRAISVMPYFETILKNNNYLVNNKLSFADIVFFIALDFGRVHKVRASEQGEGITKFYNMMNERFMN